MNYPEVLSEDNTLEFALQGRSLARYGDGELRLALGGTASAQRTQHPKLKQELREILAEPQKVLVCIPNAKAPTPKAANWERYATGRYRELLQQPVYGSSFITRPDSAPWINRPEYWNRMRQLWSGRKIILVVGTARSLTPDIVARDAKSVVTVHGPATEAYADIDRIELEILSQDGIAILCLGPTATVLAARLARKGRQALDLGHVGMFMRRLGLVT
jgi:hypothetical protein